MNPFQLQAEFARQWFGLATSIASTAMAATTMLTEQMASGWKGALAATPTSPQSNWPTGFWPGFGSLSAPHVPASINPFAVSPLPATFPMLPWMNPWGWASPMPNAMGMFAPLTVTWTLPWSGVWPFLPWTAGAARPSTSPNDLIEQVASSYRTASGYAVAAVMGPFGAALDPRTYGQPWWQTGSKRGLLN